MVRDTIETTAAELNNQAVERLNELVSGTDFSRFDDESQQLLHELQVHRIELEMQNSELRRARDEVEISLEKYTELYDFAPVGYFTLNRNEDITAANFSGATLLGVERSRLIGRCFGLWVLEADRSSFTAFLGTVYTNLGKSVSEVALVKEGKDPLFVRVEAMVGASGRECRLALIDITERKQAEDNLRSYSRRLIEMEEELRKKLAEELHDEIGRDLTVLGMNLAFISTNMTDDTPKKLLSRAADSSRLIKGISRAVRGIMLMLRPPVLDDYGLLAALRWHTDLFTKRTGIAVSIQADAPFPRLMVVEEMALFRIAQEALMNASKHAATVDVTITISITIGSDNGMLRFIVLDDGKGFTPTSFKHIQAGPGWGMKIMRERAELIGGKFYIDSTPGKGTSVSVNLPMGYA
ncbi:MAG: ATP-binding protein [Geobacteraceae bacterium]|nr:ATP-binding protein [Geobacteraceae bacterium]